MSPGWALQGTGGLTPQPLRPPMLGLVQWIKGDADLTVAATRVSFWGDQSGEGQDFVQLASPGNQPYDLGDQIDGIPCVSFGAGGDANKNMETLAAFHDRLAVPMDGAAARTIMVVWKPRFDAAFGRTGGVIWSANTWGAYFELNPNLVADGAYAWLRTGGDYANGLQFTPVTGGAGGPYNGVPTLTEWTSSGFPDISFLVNNALTALTPGALFGVPGAASNANLSGQSIACLGAFSELLVWDYRLDTAPAEHAKAIDYVRSRFPSLVLA